MIRKINLLLGFCLVLFGGWQFLTQPSDLNNLCVGIVVGTCLLVGFLLSRERNYREFPLATVCALWYPATSLFVPLMGTSLDGNPLIFKLKMPLPAFGYTALVCLVIAMAHLVFCRFSLFRNPKKAVQQFVLGRLGLFTPPTILQLWCFGAVGSLASVGLLIFLRHESQMGSGFLPQILQTLRPFAYAPFILPFMEMMGSSARPTRAQYVLLVPYAFLTVGLAVVANSRAVFAVPLITFALLAGFMVVTGRVAPGKLTWPRILGGLVVVLFLCSQLLDMASAMRITRVKRGYLDSSQMIGETVSVFFDKEQLRTYWAQGRAMSNVAGSWDEDYFQNEFLQRLSSLKFTDLSLYFTKNFGDAERKRLASFSNDRMISVLPNPLIRFLGLPVNKRVVLNMSFGDFLYGARAESFDAFRTGSFVAVDLAIHRNWFYVVLFFNALLYLFVIDCFNRAPFIGRAGNRLPVGASFAPIAMIFAYAFVQSLYQEALATTVMFYLRGLPQMIVIYLVLFHGTKKLADGLFPHFGEKRRIRRPVRLPTPV